MTADINHFLVVRHQWEAMDILKHAVERVVDHDGVVVEVPGVLENSFVLARQVLGGLREISQG